MEDTEALSYEFEVRFRDFDRLNFAFVPQSKKIMLTKWSRNLESRTTKEGNVKIQQPKPKFQPN